MDTASPGPQITHPQPPRLNSYDQPDNFCRWMEFVTSTIGSIRGGSARKHLIYFQASTGEWWFDHKLYSNVEQAWEAVRSGFVRAIELAEAGAWDQVDQIPVFAGLRHSSTRRWRSTFRMSCFRSTRRLTYAISCAN